MSRVICLLGTHEWVVYRMKTRCGRQGDPAAHEFSSVLVVTLMFIECLPVGQGAWHFACIITVNLTPNLIWKMRTNQQNNVKQKSCSSVRRCRGVLGCFESPLGSMGHKHFLWTDYIKDLLTLCPLPPLLIEPLVTHSRNRKSVTLQGEQRSGFAVSDCWRTPRA